MFIRLGAYFLFNILTLYVGWSSTSLPIKDYFSDWRYLDAKIVIVSEIIAIGLVKILDDKQKLGAGDFGLRP